MSREPENQEPDKEKGDELLKRMLKTPPKPHSSDVNKPSRERPKPIDTQKD